MTADTVRAVLRLRSLGPSGLNPPQTAVIDRLQTLAESEDALIADLDVDVWGASMETTQTEDSYPEESIQGTRATTVLTADGRQTAMKSTEQDEQSGIASKQRIQFSA